ncbi:UNVERIFIED_CONTAM: hypothetical protein RKD50_000091 [Streptomyces canus]
MPPLRHRKGFVYGEDGAIGDWTVSQTGRPARAGRGLRGTGRAPS